MLLKLAKKKGESQMSWHTWAAENPNYSSLYALISRGWERRYTNGSIEEDEEEKNKSNEDNSRQSEA